MYEELQTRMKAETAQLEERLRAASEGIPLDVSTDPDIERKLQEAQQWARETEEKSAQMQSAWEKKESEFNDKIARAKELVQEYDSRFETLREESIKERDSAAVRIDSLEKQLAEATAASFEIPQEPELNPIPQTEVKDPDSTIRLDPESPPSEVVDPVLGSDAEDPIEPDKTLPIPPKKEDPPFGDVIPKTPPPPAVPFHKKKPFLIGGAVAAAVVLWLLIWLLS